MTEEFHQLSMRLGEPYNSVNFPFSQTFYQLPSTFSATRRPSVNCRQLFVWQENLLSTFIKFPFSRENFFQVSESPRDIRSTFVCVAFGQKTVCQLLSTFRAAMRFSFHQFFIRETLHQFPLLLLAAVRPFVNFRQHSVQPGHLLSTTSTFCAAGRPVIFCQLSTLPRDLVSTSINFLSSQRPSVNFCELSVWNLRQLYMQQSNFLSTSVNVPCSRENFCQLYVPLGDILSTFIIFPCIRETFCQLLSTLHATGSPSMNFSKCSVWPGEFPFRQLQSTFHATRRPSVKFPCGWETFRQLPSTFYAARNPSFNFRQHSKWTEDQKILYFLCHQKIFRHLPSTFCPAGRPFIKFRPLFTCLGDPLSNSSTFHAAWKPSVNLRQLSSRLEDIPSTSVNFPCDQKTFHQVSLWLGNFPTTSVNFLCG